MRDRRGPLQVLATGFQCCDFLRRYHGLETPSPPRRGGLLPRPAQHPCAVEKFFLIERHSHRGPTRRTVAVNHAHSGSRDRNSACRHEVYFKNDSALQVILEPKWLRIRRELSSHPNRVRFKLHCFKNSICQNIFALRANKRPQSPKKR